MDKNVMWLRECRINKVIKALEENNMNGYLVNSKEELISKIEELTNSGDIVACGGSMSLFEAGVIDHLRSGRYEFLDRYKKDLTQEDIKEIYRKSFFADTYFASANAITEDGKIFNVDGNGNRVAAILYGPDKVVLIVGVNKIVKNIEQAVARNRAISGPANAKRLNLSTPCIKTGQCMECNIEDRICCEYTVIKRQRNPKRMHVIFINDTLGF